MITNAASKQTRRRRRRRTTTGIKWQIQKQAG
jgi:hypothetical protein